MSQASDSTEQSLRTEALESLLVEKGLVDSSAIDAVVSRYENDIGPMNGARAVARAWVDPEFKARLLADASSAFAELEISGIAEHLVVVENSGAVHNVVVCTLCSCYPWGVLGLPPAWYKSPAYRARVVREPRAVLREFRLELPEHVSVRVWDSSAEIRYMVLPERPASSEGEEDGQLRARVSRDAMIGVARAEE